MSNNADKKSTIMNVESASCSDDNEHCFDRYAGQGQIHAQFLHALGMGAENQRLDAGNYVQTQADNLLLSSSQIESKFSPLSLDDWVDNGAAFDFNSVTLIGFYDYNKRSFSDLTSQWTPSQYSVVKTGQGWV